MSFFYDLRPDLSDLFGSPVPAPGVRVVFDPELVFALRKRRLGRTVSRELKGDEGLLVHLDALDSLTCPR